MNENEMVDETNPGEVAVEETEEVRADLFGKIAQDAAVDTELFDEALGTLGETPVSIDKSKPGIKLAIPFGPRMPSEQYPERGFFVSVFCHPLSDGNLLVNYRRAEMFLANKPEDVAADKPKEAGAVIMTSGARRSSAGGFAVNQNGFRFVFCTAAAREIFANVGMPYKDEDNITSLEAQSKGSTLLDSLHAEEIEFRRAEWQRNNPQGNQQGRQQQYTRPQSTPRGSTPPVTTGGPSGDQDIGQHDFV